MAGTPKPETVSTKRQRIAELAEECPEMAFTSLAHLHRHRLAARGLSPGPAKTGPSAWTDRRRRTTRPT